MAEHTPGPWIACLGNEEDIPCICRSGDDEPFIDVYGITDDTEEARANARLIAAAPALLEALLELRTYQNGPPLPSYTEGWHRAMNMAEAALRQAGVTDG